MAALRRSLQCRAARFKRGTRKWSWQMVEWRNPILGISKKISEAVSIPISLALLDIVRCSPFSYLDIGRELLLPRAAVAPFSIVGVDQ